MYFGYNVIFVLCGTIPLLRQVCSVVTNKEVSLWELLFHKLVWECTNKLIRSCFSCLTLSPLLDETLQLWEVHSGNKETHRGKSKVVTDHF